MSSSKQQDAPSPYARIPESHQKAAFAFSRTRSDNDQTTQTSSAVSSKVPVTSVTTARSGLTLKRDDQRSGEEQYPVKRKKTESDGMMPRRSVRATNNPYGSNAPERVARTHRDRQRSDSMSKGAREEQVKASRSKKVESNRRPSAPQKLGAKTFTGPGFGYHAPVKEPPTRKLSTRPDGRPTTSGLKLAEKSPFVIHRDRYVGEVEQFSLPSLGVFDRVLRKERD